MENTECKYSLDNESNFYSTIDTSKKNRYINRYISIINQYLLYCCEKIFLQNNNNNVYTILKGIECITNIFNFLLLYTKNIELVVYHCQQSYFYYIEFIEQIRNEKNSYLKLSIKDAVLFVYRKTIFKLETTNKNKTSETKENIFFDDIFKTCREIFKILEYLLYNNNNYNGYTTDIKSIIINFEKIYTNIKNNTHMLDILIVNNDIINDIKDFYEYKYVIECLYYYNNKISKIKTSNEVIKILENYSFIYNNKYKTYTPLKLTNNIFKQSKIQT